jgi:hypothetical protein
VAAGCGRIAGSRRGYTPPASPDGTGNRRPGSGLRDGSREQKGHKGLAKMDTLAVLRQALQPF